MTRRRWWLALLAALALVWALGGEWASISHDVPEDHFLDLLVGVAYFASGIVLLDQRPGNRIGPLLVAAGFLWFTGNWANLGTPVTVLLADVGEALSTPLLATVLLTYPTGRVRDRFDGAVLAAAYVVSIALETAFALTFSPRDFGCLECDFWTPALFPSETIVSGVDTLNNWTSLLLGALFVVALVRRWHAASPAERRSSAPLWLAAIVLGIVYVVSAFGSNDTTTGFAHLVWQVNALLQLAVPVIFAWGLLSTRLARSAVGDLVVELDAATPIEGLQDSLARTLGDPSLEVAYAVGDGTTWVDVDGRPFRLPEPTEGRDGRATTLVERDGQVLAALVHDPALEPDLVRAAAAAAGMAIANERLRAQVRAQLEDVRASRQRIVEAGDRERRRVERDLHDGAQQRLVTVALSLALLRDRPGVDPSTRQALTDTSAELKAAIAELRDLARGIHPAILTEEGLGPAVESLTTRSTVPVTLVDEIDSRLPAPVEATAYFVVSESLANVAKYAHASGAVVALTRQDGTLQVDVSDDGIGGADIGRGSGLGGLQDRVAAMGGTLRVLSPAGGGTRVTAEIPTDD